MDKLAPIARIELTRPYQDNRGLSLNTRSKITRFCNPVNIIGKAAHPLVPGEQGFEVRHRQVQTNRLESGAVKSLRAIARKEGVGRSYVSRMVNLTTLAPDIVASILDETLPLEVTLFDLAVDPPALLSASDTSSFVRSRCLLFRGRFSVPLEAVDTN